jgi:acetylornithine deacetylase
VDEDRYNLLVLPQKKDAASLYFVGHLDTVTAYDLDEYGFREKGQDVFGLGTADMKSGCAAMIEAFTVLAARDGVFPPVGLALLVDEEEDNSGAKALVREYRFPWAVIGEPTDLTPCLGHYAYLEVLLRTRGRRAHSAVPEAGQNAIEAMLRLLLLFTGHVVSQEKGLVYNIRDMTGFPSGFVVPDACEAWLDLHLPPDVSIDTLEKEMRQLMKEARQEIPGLDASLEFTNIYPGYQVSPVEPSVVKLRETYRRLSLPWKTQDFRSHSDGNILSAAGVSPIILGPGRLEVAHAPEESVPFSQVVLAARVYLDLALALR